MIGRLMSLFHGLERAHGTYNIKLDSKFKEGVKVSGKAVTVMDPVTEELWQAHLDGKKGLGIVPINDESTTNFGAADIDIYPLDIKALAGQIKAEKFPLVLCRTKSGGAHLYLFTSEHVPAALIREKLGDIAVALGYGGCEIFPKQEKLASENDVGNWINMPYFASGPKTERYAVNNGRKLTLKSFLAFAESIRITQEQLTELNPLHRLGLDGAPPCIQLLATKGIPEGARNSVLFNFAVFCRNKYADDWPMQLDHMNQDFMDPPLTPREVQVVVKSVDKKQYFFTCNQEPMCSNCNKAICKKREFGIGYGVDNIAIDLGLLTKIMTDPPIWVIDVDGVRLELSTDDLLKQERFRKICVEKINRLPPRVKAAGWEAMINDRLETCEYVEAPSDAGPVGMFMHYLRQFCTGPAQANTKDEILNGKVYVNDEHVYFRGIDLLAHLERQRFRHLDHRKVWSVLRDMGAGHKEMSLKGVKTEVWFIRQFEDIDSEFDVKTTGDEI